MERCASTDQCLVLCEEGKVLSKDGGDIEILFFPYDSTGFREVHFFCHDKVPDSFATDLYQVSRYILLKKRGVYVVGSSKQ